MVEKDGMVSGLVLLWRKDVDVSLLSFSLKSHWHLGCSSGRNYQMTFYGVLWISATTHSISFVGAPSPPELAELASLSCGGHDFNDIISYGEKSGV